MGISPLLMGLTIGAWGMFSTSLRHLLHSLHLLLLRPRSEHAYAMELNGRCEKGVWRHGYLQCARGERIQHIGRVRPALVLVSYLHKQALRWNTRSVITKNTPSWERTNLIFVVMSKDSGIVPLLLLILGHAIVSYIMVWKNDFTIEFWMGYVFVGLYILTIVICVTVFGFL